MIGRDDRAANGLRWVKAWARSHITRLKRRRKYLVRRAFGPDEADTLRALLDLEESARKLLDLGGRP